MHEGCALIHIAVFGVENLWITRIDYILDYVSVLVHLGFVLIFVLSSPFSLLLLILIFLLLLSILPHHVFFTDLVITVPHLC